MSERYKVINLSLFQLENRRGPNLSVTEGIPLESNRDGELFLDPQHSWDYGPGFEDDFFIKVTQELRNSDGYHKGRIREASLPGKTNPFELRDPLGSIPLDAPVKHPIGRAALVSVAESSELRVSKIHIPPYYHGRPRAYGDARVVGKAPIRVHEDQPEPYAAKLIMLFGNAHIFVETYPERSDARQITKVSYDDLSQELETMVVDGPNRQDDDPEDFDVDGDNEPLVPTDPTRRDSVALELPKPPVKRVLAFATQVC